MSRREGQAHGRRPQMAASLRRAFETYEADPPNAGARLKQIAIADRDMRSVIDRFYDYFGEHHRKGEERGGMHPLRAAMDAAQLAADNGEDPDWEPLVDALKALPEGQLATLFAVLDLALAYAACEGMAVGAAYVQADLRGSEVRFRSRPRR